MRSRHQRSLRGLLCGLGLLFLSAAAPADILLTNDGRVIDGPRMVKGEGVIEVHFENGIVKVPEAMVHTVLGEGIQEEYEPQSLEEREKAAKGLVFYDGKWMKPSNRQKKIDKHIAEQRETVAETLAHSEWGKRHKEETKNFRWEFTIPRHVWDRYSESLEAYYKIFTKDWRVKRDKRKKKLMINFFGDRKEFQRTSGASGGALAYFMFLGDYDLCVFYDRLDGDSTEMVLFHEASHYLQKLVNEKFKYPHWPGEGLAEYYGGALWDADKKKLEVGLVQEGRLTEVQSDIALGKMMTLDSVVQEDAYTDYTWGWTLVHFLMNDKRYRKGFEKYFVGLANAKGVRREVGPFELRYVKPAESLRYFKECLGVKSDEQFAELQRDWYEYIEKDLKLESTSGLEKAALSAKRDGKPIRAKRLYEEAMEAGSTNAMAHHHYAQLLKDSNSSKARKLWEKAIELDPLVGTFHFQLGRLQKDEEEKKRMMALAKELDPEVDAWSIDLELD